MRLAEAFFDAMRGEIALRAWRALALGLPLLRVLSRLDAGLCAADAAQRALDPAL